MIKPGSKEENEYLSYLLQKYKDIKDKPESDSSKE